MEVIFEWLKDNRFAIAGIFTLLIVLLLFFRWRYRLRIEWNRIAKHNGLSLVNISRRNDFKPVNGMLLKGKRDSLDFELFGVLNDPSPPFCGFSSSILEINTENQDLVLFVNGILNKTLKESDERIIFCDVEKEGTVDAALGDPNFTRRFIVRTNDLVKVRRVLDKETQKAILSFIVSGFVPEDRFLTIRLKDQKLVIKMSAIIHNEREMMKFIGFGSDIAGKININ